jgi:hypothetical protein
MARLIIGEGVTSEDLFIPGQLFMFGSIVLHANPTGHTDQIGNFAPEHQIHFGNLEYIADVRADLVFTGFTTSPRTPWASLCPLWSLSPIRSMDRPQSFSQP